MAVADVGSLGVTLVELEGLRALSSALPDLVFACDEDHRVVLLNPAAARRWPEGEGSPAQTLFSDDVGARFMALATEALATGTAQRFEWGERDPSGVRSWYLATISVYRDGGRIVGTWCSSRDITELKRMEERLRRSEQLMVDTQGVAHLGTWEWEISQPTATWSAELFRIYGLTAETYTPSYDAYLTMVHPDDRQRVIDATNRVFHEHVPYSHDERIYRPDGSIRHLHTWAHPVLDEKGTLIRLLGVCQDITDRVIAEEAVRELNADLERRVAERTHMLETSMHDLEAFNAMVSHDLRAPLQVIQVATDLISRENPELPERSVKNMDRIRSSIARMNHLLEDLLKLARVSQTQIDRTEVDLSALSAEVIAELRRAAPQREVEIAITPELRCHADAGLMRAVMTNLLENAWKYSSRVPIARIEVGAAADQRHAFYVRDNGAGFDMAQKHKLFAPFERLHPSSEFAGTGVGLTTVQRIVERHGGHVWAEGEPGRGATFYVEIPR